MDTRGSEPGGGARPQAGGQDATHRGCPEWGSGSRGGEAAPAPRSAARSAGPSPRKPACAARAGGDSPPGRGALRAARSGLAPWHLPFPRTQGQGTRDIGGLAPPPPAPFLSERQALRGLQGGLPYSGLSRAPQALLGEEGEERSQERFLLLTAILRAPWPLFIHHPLSPIQMLIRRSWFIRSVVHHVGREEIDQREAQTRPIVHIF